MSAKLYHFTKKNTVTNHISKTLCFKLGTLENTNDPYEKKDNLFVDVEDRNDIHRLGEGIFHRIINKELNITCFCLGEAITTKKPRMWAQYSEDHEGVCIVFNKELFEKALIKTGYNHLKEKKEYVKLIDQPFYISDKIHYTNELKISLYHKIINYDNCYSNNDIYEELYNYIIYEKEPLLFQKHIDWAGEDEYRYVTFNSTSAGNIINVKDCLEEIHFGVNTPSHVIEQIYNNLKEKVNDVKIYKLIHFSGSYKLLDYSNLLDKVFLVNKLGEDKIRQLIFKHKFNHLLFDVEKFKIKLDFVNSDENYTYCYDVLSKILDSVNH